jgi:hypothetical protein
VFRKVPSLDGELGEEGLVVLAAESKTLADEILAPQQSDSKGRRFPRWRVGWKRKQFFSVIISIINNFSLQIGSITHILVGHFCPFREERA